MTDEELDTLVRKLEAQAYQQGRIARHAMLDAKSAITALRAQLAEARAERDDAIIKRAAWELEAKIQQARAERAEAALAAPEVMHEDAPAAIIGEIGNQIHNLGCELQNDEDVSLRLSDLACRTWDAAKLFPTEPTALERHDAKTREKALREAYDSLFKHPGFIHAISGQKFKAVKLEDAAEGILALIEKPNAG